MAKIDLFRSRLLGDGPEVGDRKFLLGNRVPIGRTFYRGYGSIEYYFIILLTTFCQKKNLLQKPKPTQNMTCPKDMLATSDHVLVDHAQNEHRTWGVDLSLVPETPTALRFCRPSPSVALVEEAPTTCTSCISSQTQRGWLPLIFFALFIVVYIDRV